MDDTLQFQQSLWARYTKAVEDYNYHQKKALEHETLMQDAHVRTNIYHRALKAEGIDPEKPPLLLLTGKIDEGSTTETTAPVEVEDADVTPGTDEKPQNAQQAQEQPISKTHAVYLLMRGNGHTDYTASELYELNLKAAFGLTKDDIWRVLGRQVGKGLMEKNGEAYRFTLKGQMFNSFRRKEA